MLVNGFWINDARTRKIRTGSDLRHDGWRVTVHDRHQISVYYSLSGARSGSPQLYHCQIKYLIVYIWSHNNDWPGGDFCQSSIWFPTREHPQKCCECIMTVKLKCKEAMYVTVLWLPWNAEVQTSWMGLFCPWRWHILRNDQENHAEQKCQLSHVTSWVAVHG